MPFFPGVPAGDNREKVCVGVCVGEVMLLCVVASLWVRVVLFGDTNKVCYTRCIELKMYFDSLSRPHWGQEKRRSKYDNSSLR